ncbi:MAG: metal ABC transporter permease [Burkholderiales bacterium]
MSFADFDFGILPFALIAGLLVTLTHVPLGMQVLARGIVFIDLAIAQIAGVGVMLADSIGLEPQGFAVQIAALSAALIGALFLTWTDKKFPDVQEAIIGVAFILAASGGMLLIAGNPHGGEHLKDMLVGQILWVNKTSLIVTAIAYAGLLAVWFGFKDRIGRVGFYCLFACAVTASVQLVGLYLVFTTLIVPALATRKLEKHRLPWAYALGVAGYLIGLLVSVKADLPSGAVIVWTMVVLGIVLHAWISAHMMKAVK